MRVQSTKYGNKNRKLLPLPFYRVVCLLLLLLLKLVMLMLYVSYVILALL